MARKDREILTKKHIARLERERRQSRIFRWVAIVIAAFVIFGWIGTAFWDGSLSIGNFDINYLRRNQPIIQLGEDEVNTREFQNYVRLQRNQMIGQYIQYLQYQQYFGLDVTAQLDQITAQLGPEGAASIGQTTIDQLVDDLLIRQEAAKRGITVSDDEIDAYLETVFGYFPNGTPSPTVTATEPVFSTLSADQLKLVTLTPTITETPLETPTETGTPAATETQLPTITLTPNLTTTATATVPPTATETPTVTPTSTATATLTTVPTITPTFTPEPTATPFTLEAFQESLTTSKAEYEKLGLTEADFKNLVLRDLLRKKLYEVITADVEPFEEQVWARHILAIDEETAKSIRERLLKGEDFAALAAEFSQDTSNKDSGGDLGWFGMGQMVPEFETAAFALSVGEISQPVNTDYGWHIIQVIGHEKRPLSADAFTQLKDTVFNEWLAEARTEAEAAGLLVIFDYWTDRVPLDPTIEEVLNQPTPTP